MTDDYDSPWKEILERYFCDFMAFFFPHAAAQIDWSRGYETLDNHRLCYPSGDAGVRRQPLRDRRAGPPRGPGDAPRSPGPAGR